MADRNRSPGRPASSAKTGKSQPTKSQAGKSHKTGNKPNSKVDLSGHSTDMSVNTTLSKTPDFNVPKCNVQGFSKTGDYESWMHPGLHKFCHEIVAKLYKTNSNRNFLMSPVTAYITIGMMSVGSKEKTLEEICELLKVKETIEKSVKESSMILDHITTDREFRIHNTDGVFVHAKYPINPTFRNLILRKFKAEALHANFDSKTEAAQAMNAWLKKATRGRIREIVHETQRDSLLYVCNTVYMKSQWEMEFPKKLTREGTFNVMGKKVSVLYMNKADTFEYVDNSDHGFEVIFLPYEGQIERDRWQMAIFLPNNRITMAKMAHFIKSKHLRYPIYFHQLYWDTWWDIYAHKSRCVQYKWKANESYQNWNLSSVTYRICTVHASC